MIKTELLRVLNKHCPGLQKSDVHSALNCIIEQIATALAHGERVEIRGFGSFNLRHRRSRLARNPKTGDAVTTQAKAVVHFKPGKDMKARVNAGRG